MNFGCLFEVDLVFGKENHDKFQELTPVPYKLKIGFEELFPGQQDLVRKLGITDSTVDAKRLLADFHLKKNCVVHYRVLSVYKLGIRLTKVHNGFQFRQKVVLSHT